MTNNRPDVVDQPLKNEQNLMTSLQEERTFFRLIVTYHARFCKGFVEKKSSLHSGCLFCTSYRDMPTLFKRMSPK
jgi:hypothetical protein